MKAYLVQGPRREINLQNISIKHGIAWIKHPNGEILTKRVKSIALELE